MSPSAVDRSEDPQPSPGLPGGVAARADRELFNEIAERYARKDLHTASHPARRLRLTQSVRLAALPAEATIVEIGCGAGFSARYLAGRYRRFVGIDYADRLIAYARRHNALPGARFIAADLFDLPDDFEAYGQADLVLMVGVLHHMPDPKRAIERAAQLARPGGFVVANEPSAGNPLIGLARRARKALDRDYSSEQREMGAAELDRTFRAAGLSSVHVVPQGLLSTPFAEIALRPAALTRPAALAACAVDRTLERFGRRLLLPLCWNVVGVGQRPIDAR